MLRIKMFVVALLVVCFVELRAQASRWSEKQANDWYAKQGWITGSNFQPSTAINQLEMFQKETFDLATIDREFGWA
ncbi:MAG TPA: 1,4-beta-xylanase, partial [Cyclobacteriaceae bacterium]|nr:1,4-beta-xylanase [Cyclobacteriaceae bacterium]